ncbi:rod shape-determining protein MreD [Christensenellaceae bacterium OttesenSCG-928-L17]|nr:rod shape-determining protein MreD [Christensenellaceae bacterium OttesenSCG-928-L17]
MRRRVVAAIAIALCLYLDTIFFARVNLFDVRADAMLAATVAYAILLGPVAGAVFGGIGGLAMDILVGPYLGLSAAMYVACGLLGGVFYQKYYADNVVVPAAATLVACMAKEFLYAAITAIRGAEFSFGRMFVQYMLPCALLSALLCMLFHLVLKPLLATQVKRQQLS